MKKYILFLWLLTSCKSITYQDVNPVINPNPNLLPALETIVDVYNLESTYSSGSYYGQADTFGTGYSGNNNWSNWFQTTSLSGTQYKDPRVGDVINIFDKEVKENISSPYGSKKGYISLKLGYRGSDMSLIYPITTIVNLGLLNIFGFPGNKINESLEVEVQIINNKKEVVGRYVETVINSDYIALWWGYSKYTIYRKVAADNIKMALKNIRYRINNDYEKLEKQLR